MKSTSGGVLRSAGLMGIATLLSRILGLVREQVFAFLFGASHAADAFLVAFRIPNLLRDLFAEGAMSAALVPTFTQTREQEGQQRAWRIAGLIFRVLFAIAVVIAVIGILFSDALVELYAHSYHQTPGKFELTVLLTRWMFPFFPLVALAAAYMSVLNANRIFFLPALSSALFNLASITLGGGLAYYLQKMGHLSHFSVLRSITPIEAMAMGVVFGGAVQAFCQLPTLYRAGYRFLKKQASEPPWYREPALKQMLMLMVPGTFGLAATQVNILVNTILATSQGGGAVAWLSYAFRLMQFPIGVFGVSLGTATLPHVSELWVKKQYSEIEKTLHQSLKHVLALNLPSAFGLSVLSVPIIALLFQHGRFHEADTEATAFALVMYAIGLPAYSAVKVLVPAFYGIQNTRIPVISSVFSVLLTIVLNLWMVSSFGYWGLALGTSLAAIFNALFLMIAFQRFFIRKLNHSFRWLPVLGVVLRQFVLSSVMALACFWGRSTLSSTSVFVQVIVLVGLGISVLGIGAKLIRAHETLEIFELFSKKLKKKLSSAQT